MDFGLAQGKSINEILNDLGEVAEGVGTAEALFNIAKKNNIYLPIADEVYKMINGKKPEESLNDLLNR